uniref:Uncharacterized protein n=1 Tax=Arundo donax TaxID=35708 RepID=A0A0A9CAI1_ARUDO
MGSSGMRRPNKHSESSSSIYKTCLCWFHHYLMKYYCCM